MKNPREILKPFTGEMYQFILANARRFLTEQQKELLCFDLYSRLENPEEVDRRISEMKEKFDIPPVVAENLNNLVPIHEYPITPGQPDHRFLLFQHLSRLHGLTLLESDLDEVRGLADGQSPLGDLYRYFEDQHSKKLTLEEIGGIVFACREIDRLEKKDFERKP